MGMDLATPFCPNPDCPARGQPGQGNPGIHSRKEQRFICKQYHKTFTTAKGTAFYRVRTPAETISLVLTSSGHPRALTWDRAAAGSPHLRVRGPTAPTARRPHTILFSSITLQTWHLTLYGLAFAA